MPLIICYFKFTKIPNHTHSMKIRKTLANHIGQSLERFQLFRSKSLSLLCNSSFVIKNFSLKKQLFLHLISFIKTVFMTHNLWIINVLDSNVEFRISKNFLIWINKNNWFLFLLRKKSLEPIPEANYINIWK